MATAPGVSINVNAASSSPRQNPPTSTWFVTGVASGPSGVAVPINSMQDFQTYFGRVVNGSLTGRYTGQGTSSVLDSTLLFDALDVFFREGGVNAFVSAAVASSGTKATGSAGLTTLTAAGAGTWANSSSSNSNGLILAITFVAASQYIAQISFNGNVMATSPVLGGDTDIRNWINSLPAYIGLAAATTAGSVTNALPTTGTTKYYFTGGLDAAVADADYATALTFFTDTYGPGQVSAPGVTTAAVYASLTNHALAFNRVALLDGANTGTAATLTSAVITLQSAATDASYAAMFAPWLVVPGISNINPGNTTNLVFNRTVAPSALAAANIAQTDQSNDCNLPAAGIAHGSSTYAVNVSQTFSATDRASLNAGGVNVIRNVPNVNTIAIYGFRSCAVDPAWQFFNNVRFRMQAVRDFDIIGESFIFSEIDGKGQIFSKLQGALAGQCQAYWIRKSIYGANASDAFTVNCGPQINTPATIAAGQLNAQVNLRMSPFGELVTINITKYNITSALPNYNQ